MKKAKKARIVTTVTYMDPGKGYTTRMCWNCTGTGRVHEGGHGLRDCPMCAHASKSIGGK